MQTSKKITSKNVETYLKSLTCLSADFVQRDISGEYSGHMYLLKDKKRQDVCIDYTEGAHRKMFVKDGFMTILELDSHKEDVFSITQTPFYTILSDGLNLSKEDCAIDDLDINSVYVTINNVSIYGKSQVTLVFSRYQNGNIKNLEGWIIKEPNGNTVFFSLIPEGMSVNDKSKIPSDAFSKK